MNMLGLVCTEVSKKLYILKKLSLDSLNLHQVVSFLNKITIVCLSTTIARMNSFSYNSNSTHLHTKNNNNNHSTLSTYAPNHMSLSPSSINQSNEYDLCDKTNNYQFKNNYKFSPLSQMDKSLSLSPSLKPSKPQTILISAPMQSLTSQIYDNESICAEIDDDHEHQKNKYFDITLTNNNNPNNNMIMEKMEPLLLTNASSMSMEYEQNDNMHFKDWSNSRSTYQKISKLESQQRYIDNLSKEIQIKSIFIMDWDDTIFPTTAYNILKKQSLQDNFWQFIDTNYYKFPVLSGFVAIINKCIEDTYNFMMQQINENNSIILIISNGNYQWLQQCMNGCKAISKLKSVQKLQKALNDKTIPIKLISAKSEFVQHLRPSDNSSRDLTDDEYMNKCKINKRSNSKSKQSRISIIRKQTAFVKYLKEIKSKYHHETDLFCVYCIGDDDSEFEASKIAMNIVFGDKEHPINKNKDNPYLLIRHKLDIDRGRDSKYCAKNALQSILINVDSFYIMCCY